MQLSLGAFLLSFPAALALVQSNGVGKLPALGWNSWNAYGCDINEARFLSAANLMVKLGFKAAGYEYVNIDDCWSVKTGRNSATKQLVPDSTKFPDGISGLASQVHALGLKLGIYSSAGTETCAGYPASIGYESIDAATWAAWGVDYLKYDNCYIPNNWTDACQSCNYDLNNPGGFVNGTCGKSASLCPTGYDYSASNSAKRYRIMRDALLAQNRTIQYSMCIWGQANVEQWGNATGNSWRMSYDIQSTWKSVVSILNINTFILNGVGFWGHNDVDMLEVGNGALTAEETRSHFAFWAAMKSPLIIGTNLATLSQQNIDILLNKYLLAFNQDPVFGAPAKPYKWGTNPDWTYNATNPAEFWSGKSQNGTLVLLLNTLASSRNMTALFSEIPGLTKGAAYNVLDVWTGASKGSSKDGVTVTVRPHDTAAFLLSEALISTDSTTKPGGSNSSSSSDSASSGSYTRLGHFVCWSITVCSIVAQLL